MPNKVTVRKAELTEKLRTNRAQHRSIFEQACEAYRKKAIELVEERVAEIRSGRIVALAFALPIPEDHTREYDRALEMLTMEVADEVVLDEQEFAELVMDDWSWKRAWMTSTASYVSMPE